MPSAPPDPRAAVWSLQSVSVDGRLSDVSLDIGPGVTHVVGPSGAGKTTLLDVLAGSVDPTAGTREGGGGYVLWCGCGQGLWPGRTAGQQIDDVGGDRSWLQRFGLEGRTDERPAALSLGQRSRLELARALAAEPETLLLDEPLTHVDDEAAAAGWRAIAEFAASGRTVVIAAHRQPTVDGLDGLDGPVVRLREGRVVDA